MRAPLNPPFAILALSLLVAPLTAQSPILAREATDAEALAAMQGSDTSLFLQPSRVRAVTAFLRQTRARYPQLANIHAGFTTGTLVVFLIDSLRTQPPPPLPCTPSRPLRATGLPAMDSLNCRLAATLSDQEYQDKGRTMTYVSIAGWTNLDALATAYSQVPGVWGAIPSEGLGGGSSVRYFRKPGVEHLIFVRGYGDCPSGCIHRDYYYVTRQLGSDSIVLERTVIDAKRSDVAREVQLWDTPTQLSYQMYPTVDSLLSGTRAAQWWVRLHALRVLDYMLGPNQVPWHQAPDNRPADFAALQDSLRSRWKPAVQSILGMFEDPDPDLRGMAPKVLRQLFQSRHPPADDSAAAWHKWLANQP